MLFLRDLEIILFQGATPIIFEDMMIHRDTNALRQLGYVRFLLLPLFTSVLPSMIFPEKFRQEFFRFI
jgi:hypothetical protein